MKHIFSGLLVLTLMSCSAASAVPVQSPGKSAQVNLSTNETMISDLPVLGKAPELTNEIWLNVDQPLRFADLRGKVVLLDMWTFGCINCRNVIPSLKGWHTKYSSEGLVIIGNHFPEFESERSLENLKDAVKRLDIPYAVAQDNDGKTWSAFNNAYWPSLYLIDKQGNIRYRHIGEGAYSETEAAIQALLAEPS